MAPFPYDLIQVSPVAPSRFSLFFLTHCTSPWIILYIPFGLWLPSHLYSVAIDRRSVTSILKLSWSGLRKNTRTWERGDSCSHGWSTSTISVFFATLSVCSIPKTLLDRDNCNQLFQIQLSAPTWSANHQICRKEAVCFACNWLVVSPIFSILIVLVTMYFSFSM